MAPLTDNLSIFVDAGYLYKQGALAVFGETMGRHQLQLNAGPFVVGLTDWLCTLFQREELLRTYWYDGAKSGLAGGEQLTIAGLPYVKLRLGRINSAGQQKGVDTLIVRDLMVLSQERSITRAVVLSGDEDLREGLAYAQDRGVSLVVVGIDSKQGRSQSVELLRECDEHLILPPHLLREHLRQSGEAAPRLPLPVEDPLTLTGPARKYAESWRGRATPEQLGDLIASRPRIPYEIDGELLTHVREQAGVTRSLNQDECRTIRKAFWSALAGDDEPPPTPELGSPMRRGSN